MSVDYGFSDRIRFIDTHAGGEPTRIVIEGYPDLGEGSMFERREVFRTKFDHFRSAVINEPRGSDVFVGAILCEPTDPSCVAGVIFFNNVGYLNMCGHGTMCVAVALGYMGRISSGTYGLETPVGIVSFDYDGKHTVTITNVPSYRYAKDVVVEIEGFGTVNGDVAWGGNWFFLVDEHGQELELSNVERLTEFTWQIRKALQRQGVVGDGGAEIDHIELFGQPKNPKANSRNFVLCPGKVYDRSPCGTGTSAKIACLISDKKLKPGEIWRQESIVGSIFEAWGEIKGGRVIPHLRGTAYVMAEGTLILQPEDPFKFGIRA